MNRRKKREKSVHNIREDKKKTDGPKAITAATEDAYMANQTKLSNISKQRR